MKCPNNIHKYRRFRRSAAEIKAGKLVIFRCIRPGCSHFVTRNFVIGRLAECWACGLTFAMSEKSLQMKPHCGCRVTKVMRPAAAEEIKDAILSKIGGM